MNSQVSTECSSSHGVCEFTIHLCLFIYVAFLNRQDFTVQLCTVLPYFDKRKQVHFLCFGENEKNVNILALHSEISFF